MNFYLEYFYVFCSLYLLCFVYIQFDAPVAPPPCYATAFNDLFSMKTVYIL